MSNTYRLNPKKGKLRKNLISFLNEDDELPLEAGKVLHSVKKNYKPRKGNSIEK